MSFHINKSFLQRIDSSEYCTIVITVIWKYSDVSVSFSRILRFKCCFPFFISIIHFEIHDFTIYWCQSMLRLKKAKIKQNHRVPDDTECDGYWWSAWIMMLILNCWMKNTNIPSNLTWCVPKSCIAPPKSSVRKQDRNYHRNQLFIRYFQHLLQFQNQFPVVLREVMSLFPTSPNFYL